MSHSNENKSWKLQGALLVVMLLLFIAVYNRRALFHSIDPQPPVAENGPGNRRAGSLWNRTHVDSSIHIVKDGDLVLRSGADAISALFKKVNTRDKTYSHAGIVFIENGYPFVYNCIGNASDPYAFIKRDSLNTYIAPYNNTGFALYRFQLDKKQIEQLHDIAVRYYKEKRTFDPHFDLATDSALYCTEFVFKAVGEAAKDKKYFPITQAAHFSYVAADNLFARKDTRLVCKIAYKQ